MAKQDTAKQEPAKTPAPTETAADELAYGRPSIFERMKIWAQEEGPWWLCSFVFHMLLVCSLALISTKAIEAVTDEAPSFDEAKVDKNKEPPKEMERFEVGDTPYDPTELSTDTLTLEKPATLAVEAEYNDDSTVFEHKGGGMMAASDQPNLGGLGGFDVKAIGPGPVVRGKGGVGVGVGTGKNPGSGGDGWGFGGRGSGSRKAMLASGGGTRASERAVAAALLWLAKHQSPNGSWSLKGYNAHCKDATCTGPGNGDHDSGATAMGLLPFLAAGQTHESKGPYQRNIQAGIYWMLGAQKPNGDLRAGSSMYSHGLASIALCECYGMTGDKRVGLAAQKALDFIVEAQDKAGGGWRYNPGQAGDTSVVGWQIMALKSGQMAYLNVNPAVFEKAKEFLKSVSSGQYGGQFGYTGPGGTTTMTSVGLLCSQYLKVPKNDPGMMEGTAFLMKNMPDNAARNLYYWYYATQVMHNIPGPDWDAWNRKVRRVLIDSQAKEGCASGSWDPNAPAADQWGSHGGRVMMTALSALTLEVYYRYLPLYKLDKEEGGGPPAPAAGKPEAAKPDAAKPEAKPEAKQAGK